MSTPTNPFLINQLEEVFSSGPADFLLIQQGGVFKKLAGNSFDSSSGIWTKNPDNSIFYDTNFVGIGISAPAFPLDIEAINQIEKGILLESKSADGNQMIISDNGLGVGRRPGIAFVRDLGVNLIWSLYYDVDTDTLNISREGMIDIRMKLLPDGGVILPNMISGSWGAVYGWYKDGNNMMVI